MFPPAIQLDHILCYVDAPSIDGYLQGYRAAGFAVAEQTARHGGGLRNGFVGFGPDYLELVWVEDEARFAEGHPRMPELTRPDLRRAHRPFAIGLLSPDVHAAREAWLAQGYDLPPLFAEVPPGAPPGTPPALSIQPIPPRVLPGAVCFALTYHFAAKPWQITVPPSTAYAIGGVTFVANLPGERARQWRDLLAPNTSMAGFDGGATFVLGPHTLRWLMPGQFERSFGRDWQPVPHPYGELAVVHVLAERLDRAEAQIRRAGMPLGCCQDPATGEPMLLVGPGSRDGFLLALTQYPAEQWAVERRSNTGEEFDLVANAADVSDST